MQNDNHYWIIRLILSDGYSLHGLAYHDLTSARICDHEELLNTQCEILNSVRRLEQGELDFRYSIVFHESTYICHDYELITEEHIKPDTIRECKRKRGA